MLLAGQQLDLWQLLLTLLFTGLSVLEVFGSSSWLWDKRQRKQSGFQGARVCVRLRARMRIGQKDKVFSAGSRVQLHCTDRVWTGRGGGSCVTGRVKCICRRGRRRIGRLGS